MSEPRRLPLQDRIRSTFIAGIFSFVPLAVTAFIIYWINDKTSIITQWIFKRSIPFLGVLIALAAVYVTGMIVTSFMGKFLLRVIDVILIRLPIVRQIYQAWKHIALTPGGTEGMFARVALIPDESGQLRILGFSNGRVIEASEPMYCVFVPSSPNPITGRLYFAPVDKCQFIDMTAEEAFKIILSTGNYVPPLIPRSLIGSK